MWRVSAVLVCVTSSAASSASPDNQYTTTASENFSFLNAIQRNLRRNNEDYVVDQRTNQRQETVTEAEEVTPFIGTTADTLSTHFRSETRQDKQKMVLAGENVPHAQFQKQEARDTKPRQHRDYKLKSLVDKSKDLIQYVSSSATVGTRGQPGRLRTLSNTRKPRSRPVERARSSLHELFTKRTQGPNREPPNADQLDLAPARGAFINDMRGKGLLCQRHILWPEGPKYDSQGNIIMPLHRPKWYGGKDFAQTRKPRLVLPRCCNCCKKSVLGCQ